MDHNTAFCVEKQCTKSDVLEFFSLSGSTTPEGLDDAMHDHQGEPQMIYCIIPEDNEVYLLKNCPSSAVTFPA